VWVKNSFNMLNLFVFPELIEIKYFIVHTIQKIHDRNVRNKITIINKNIC